MFPLYIFFIRAVQRDGYRHSRENRHTEKICLDHKSELIHTQLGVSFQENDVLLQYQSPTTIKFTLPLDVKVGEGPYQAQG